MTRQLKVGLFVILGLALTMISVFLIGDTRGLWQPKVGYRTAFVRRPDEWGTAGPPDPTPDPGLDLVVDGFAQLADALGC